MVGGDPERRLAAVTYYREPAMPVHQLPSRGKLAADFLTGTMTPEEYLETLRHEEQASAASTCCSETTAAFYYTNRGDVSVRVSPGIHGLSNGLLDTPWPKVVAAKERLERLLRKDTLSRRRCLGSFPTGAPSPTHCYPTPESASNGNGTSHPSSSPEASTGPALRRYF